jgi:carbon-monoxide dehydrogenase medium subunit
VNLVLNDDGSCKSAGVGVTGVGVKAYRAKAVEAALAGSNLDDNAIANAATHVCDGIDPSTDLYASGDYRRHLAQVHTRRAIQAANSRI